MDYKQHLAEIYLPSMPQILNRNGWNTCLRNEFFFLRIINFLYMKIIIRYYSQWGNMSTKPCTVNPNVKVAQLKQQIAQITGINA